MCNGGEIFFKLAANSCKYEKLFPTSKIIAYICCYKHVN